MGTEGQEGSGSPRRKEGSVPCLGQEDGGRGRDELDRPGWPGAGDAAGVGSSCSPACTYSPPRSSQASRQPAEGRESVGGWFTGCLSDWHSWFGWSWHLGKRKRWGQVRMLLGAPGEDRKTRGGEGGEGGSFVHRSIPVDPRLPWPTTQPQKPHWALSVPAPGTRTLTPHPQPSSLDRGVQVPSPSPSEPGVGEPKASVPSGSLLSVHPHLVSFGDQAAGKDRGRQQPPPLSIPPQARSARPQDPRLGVPGTGPRGAARWAGRARECAGWGRGHGIGPGAGSSTGME